MFHTFSHKISFKHVISELPPLVNLEPKYRSFNLSIYFSLVTNAFDL
jgi:hypothetical protein